MAKIDNDICYELNSNVSLLADFCGSTLEFSCGNAEIDRYFKESADKDCDCVTYVFSDTDTGDIIAFASLRCSGIIFQDSNHIELFPAIEIRYFATDERFQHIQMQTDLPEDRYCISDSVFCELMRMIRDISCRTVGAEYVVLYSVPSAVGFYRRNLFEEFNEAFTPERHRYINDCLPMYLPL
jgi:hypothetical protein